MIQHVALEVSPAVLEAEVAFWARLGFTEVTPPEAVGATRTRWVERAGTQIHLLAEDDPSLPPARGHVAVVAEDFEGACAALRDAGAPVDERRALWGERRAKTTSPCGHVVELMAAPPPASA